MVPGSLRLRGGQGCVMKVLTQAAYSRLPQLGLQCHPASSLSNKAGGWDVGGGKWGIFPGETQNLLLGHDKWKGKFFSILNVLAGLKVKSA